VLRRLLDQKRGLPYAARAVLVTKLGLPSALLESANPATNAVENVSTNSAATNSPAK